MYTVAQCHLHWGSEHTFGGAQDPLCMHCVHTKDDAVSGRTYGVLGFSWNLGAEDAFLAQWIGTAPASGAAAVTGASIDMTLSYANMNLAQYWQYDGGLTTPPCSEIVDWHVLMERRTLTQAQLDIIVATTDVTGGNFRLPQPIGSRGVMGCAWHWPEDATWNAVDNSVCGTGVEQSPIDLPVCTHITDSANPIVPTNWGTATEIVYSHGMKINMPGTGTAFQTSMRGSMYTVAQCHLHWGSEHTFDGAQDPLCMHCVHTKDDATSGRTYGVLGFSWNLGAEDAFLAQWIGTAPASGAAAVTGASIDMALSYANMNLAQYWQYDGGLTTPPCSEVVDWHVLMERRTLTQAQLDTIVATTDVTG